jgi:hypothetical protein
MGIIAIVATLIFILSVVMVGEGRLRAKGIDIDDRQPAD